MGNILHLKYFNLTIKIEIYYVRHTNSKTHFNLFLL